MLIYKYIVSGRVQKVGFRNFVWKQAKELGLEGYTKNLADGRVEVLACFGTVAEQEVFEQALHRGPIFAKVREVKKTKVEEYAKKGFEILFD